MLASHKSQRQSICITKKYLQNYVLQQRVAPGIASHVNATVFLKRMLFLQNCQIFIS